MAWKTTLDSPRMAPRDAGTVYDLNKQTNKQTNKQLSGITKHNAHQSQNLKQRIYIIGEFSFLQTIVTVLNRLCTRIIYPGTTSIMKFVWDF